MKRNHIAVAAALAIALVFGAAYAAFGLSSPHIWNSPDETAVAFFSQTFAAGGKLWMLTNQNIFGDDMVHPRSMIAIGGYLIPGSFYGAMWVVGAAVRLMGDAALSITTPLLTSLAALVVFFALRRLWGARAAFAGEILFLSCPGVWYYASRGLFPNVLFIDLAILGLGFLFLRPWNAVAKGRGNPLLELFIDDFIGTVFLGLAFAVRPVEFLWLGPVLAAAAIMNRKQIRWFRYIGPFLISAGVIVGLLVVNNSLYGSPFAFGYTAGAADPGVSAPAVTQGSRLPQVITAPRPFILPFGLHPHAAAVNFWNYEIIYAPLLFVFAAIGFAALKKSRLKTWFGIGVIFIAAILGLYYGSGIFTDTPGNVLSIGSSYIRYFLPFSVALVPFAVYGMVWLGERLCRKRPFIPITVFCVLTVGLSAWIVYSRNQESLVPVWNTLRHYAAVKAEVLKLTKTQDVIVVERSDKVFFPDRQVMLNLRDQKTIDTLMILRHTSDLYYYGITISPSEMPEISKRLGERRFQIAPVKAFDTETLYSITTIQNKK